MAASERPIDSLNWAQGYIKNMPLYRLQKEILNDAAKYFWRAAPWRWTLGSMPVVSLTNNNQEYAVTLPADFFYIEQANLIESNKITKELEVVPFIPLEGVKYGQPGQISVLGSGASGFYRVAPVPSGYVSFPQITGIYKKEYTELTETTIYSPGTLIFPDLYTDVFRACVLYYAYLYADDTRAGNVQFGGKNSTYTGQRAVMEAAIQEIREREPMPLIDVQTSPNPRKEKD